MATYAVTVHQAGQPDVNLVIDAVDVAAIAPVLSSPLDTKTGDTTADATVTTDRATGTLYVVASTALPSAAQIKLGQNSTGAAASIAESQAVTTVGAQTIELTGLTPATAYAALRFMHEDEDTNQSNVVSGDGFTTDAATSVPYSETNSDPTAAFSSSNTSINRNFAIDNDATIESIGMYLGSPKATTIKIVKRDSAGQYDVVVSESFAHPGGGWADKTLSAPYVVPATGDYHVAAFVSTAGSINMLASQARATKTGNVVGNDTTGWVEVTGNCPCFRVTGTIPA